VTTAQHREMLDHILGSFGVRPDIDLGLMQQNQMLGGFAARSLTALSNLFSQLQPDAILIQGDTTTVVTAALAAYYQDIRIGHVEAGLRSFDKRNPFPEEMNRRITACLADMHFAPTEGARANLVREGVSDENIFVTGNTIVDALKSISIGARFDNPMLDRLDFNGRVILVTAHRRENHGAALRSICRALKLIVARFEDVHIVCPVHMNPEVTTVVHEEMGRSERIHLVEPVSYRDILNLVSRCYLILTDSGGLQEEAPSFGKPVLVLRKVTERPELIEVNGGRIVGTDTGDVLEAASLLLTSKTEYETMCRAPNPFGDGRAAERIVDLLARKLDAINKAGNVGTQHDPE
jgi:UDP-N-acetylglucosamine 2-epimerase (non-hydrolysing)